MSAESVPPPSGSLGDLVLLLDYGGVVIDANAAFCSAIGRPPDEVTGTMLAAYVHPQARSRMVIVRGSFAHGAHEVEGPLGLVDGTYRWCRWSLSPAAGIAGALRVVGMDVDGDLRRTERPASTNEGVLALGFAQSPTGMAITEIDAERGRERVIRVNRAATDLLGFSEEEFLAEGERILGVDALRDQGSGKRLVRRGPDFVEIERPLERRDGSEIWVVMHADTVRDTSGRPLNRTIRFHDITSQHEEENALRYLADHDPLTGLINRRRFREEVRRAVRTSDRFGDPSAVLFVDLDGFKDLNDACGHAVGDGCLIRVAGILQHAVRDIDVVGRFGGDEFAVLLVRTQPDDAARIADALRAEVAATGYPLLDGTMAHVTISVGIAMVEPGTDASAADHMIAADVAMYEAKRAGRDTVRVYSHERGAEPHPEDRLVWAARIRQALDDDGFVLVEQPIVRADDRVIDGYALRLRLPDADGRLLRPGVFLYAAARVGLTERVDRWVVSRALDYLERLEEDAGFLEVRISSDLIADEEAVAGVLAEIRARADDPSRLVLILDDRALLGARAAVDRFVRDAHSTGCRVGLDRFGSGYASFPQLRGISFDVVRIDEQIVGGVVDDALARLFLETMVRLAHGLGATVLAPYVGDATLLPNLAEYGCDHVQGHAVGAIEPAEDGLPLAPRSG